MFHSDDPLNGTVPGAGILGGLHISFSAINGQLNLAFAGDALFGGALDATGAFSLTIPGPVLSALSGQTWWSVGVQVNPSPAIPYEATPVTSITFQ